jgi:hypothetical protein
VLGKYSIDADGDTTLTDYGLYAVENGQLSFDQVIKAAGQPKRSSAAPTTDSASIWWCS